MVVGFVERDVAHAAVLLDLAEAHEGVHLMAVAPHRLGHGLEPVEAWVGTVLHARALVGQRDQLFVEQREALAVGVENRLLGERQERPRDGERPRTVRRRQQGQATEQFPLVPLNTPADLRRVDAGQG